MNAKNMKRFGFSIALLALIPIAGCNLSTTGTSGGPGASSPGKTERMGQTDKTFNLSIPKVTLAQGERKTIAVKINRGTNFSESVALEIAEMPPGVTITPSVSDILNTQTQTELTLSAAPDAAVGDFTVDVTGRPTSGGDAVTEMKITVVESESEDIAEETAEGN